MFSNKMNISSGLVTIYLSNIEGNRLSLSGLNISQESVLGEFLR